MCQEQQFWWNWWVSFAAAAATVLVVVVALLGDWFRAWFRSKFWSPVLRLKLLDPAGLLERIRHEAQSKAGVTIAPEWFEDARYYHVRISNERRRLSPAKDVQVFLTRVEEPGPAGSFQITWSGEIPMRWRNQQLYPLARNIGGDADCDLCTVGKGRWLSLSPMNCPYSLPAFRNAACTMIVSLQARSAEVDFPVQRIKIAWDGDWADGETEMKRHLEVAELLDSAK